MGDVGQGRGSGGTGTDATHSYWVESDRVPAN